jgi:hypothetical protein
MKTARRVLAIALLVVPAVAAEASTIWHVDGGGIEEAR